MQTNFKIYKAALTLYLLTLPDEHRLKATPSSTGDNMTRKLMTCNFGYKLQEEEEEQFHNPDVVYSSSITDGMCPLCCNDSKCNIIYYPHNCMITIMQYDYYHNLSCGPSIFKLFGGSHTESPPNYLTSIVT